MGGKRQCEKWIVASKTIEGDSCMFEVVSDVSECRLAQRDP